MTRVIQIGVADLGRAMGAKLLVACPSAPRRVPDGTVDEDCQRWRFKNDELVAYFLYPKRNARSRPWKAYWVAPGYVG